LEDRLTKILREKYKELVSNYLQKLKEETPEKLKKYRQRAYQQKKEKMKQLENIIENNTI
jgi:DNA-binding protein H-NS